MAFIYLICDPSNDFYKIGLTRSHLFDSKRIKQLQTGNGTELHLSSYYETEHPFILEKMLHNRFSSKQESGEWFKLTNEDITSFKDICDNLTSIIHSLSDNPFFVKDLR